MNIEATATKSTYAGLFLITLSTLMCEILLTRIFSVTMFYHFAFMAISIAMFGMTVGAIVVYLYPQYFINQRANYHLALSSLLFSVSIVICFLIQLRLPVTFDNKILFCILLGVTFLIISIPFIFSGISVCVALTKFPGRVSKLYAADLAGAAAGCLILVYVLDILDALTAVILVAFIAGIGAVVFFNKSGYKKLLNVAIINTILLGTFIVINTYSVHVGTPLLRLRWMKGDTKSIPLHEKWNSFSYIRIMGDPEKPEGPRGWGISRVYPYKRKVRQLMLEIDNFAGTLLTHYDGNVEDIGHLKYDITNLAHYIRKDARVLVIGSGGGRDILSALAFDQKAVLGVEINKDIIKAVNKTFGDFTGHLDKDPRVTFINDEARSYIARLNEKFDIIQVSLIDTWAATTSGAFVLTENSIYTIEAWKTFLDHLTPRGVLTFSRWYFRDDPSEMYRLTSLASASLMEIGIKNPRKNIIIARYMQKKNYAANYGVGTIIVSKEPFSNKDIKTIDEVTRKLRFDMILNPNFALDSVFDTLASGVNMEELLADYPINISPPTDDSPFFFNMLRLRNMLNLKMMKQGCTSFNMQAILILGSLLIIVSVLTFLCIIVPLLSKTGRGVLAGNITFLIFFGGIGFGFMLIEISQLQRLNIFLGHPIYGLSVVLFSLLISSGIGSFTTNKMSERYFKVDALTRMALILVSLILFGLLTPYVIDWYAGSTTKIRILMAAAIIFPLGFFMGMAFPIGMKIASMKSSDITPWLWGINGATSVNASVLAVAIALSSGISAAYWTGFSCYCCAVLAFIWSGKSKG